MKNANRRMNKIMAAVLCAALIMSVTGCSSFLRSDENTGVSALPLQRHLSLKNRRQL